MIYVFHEATQEQAYGFFDFSSDMKISEIWNSKYYNWMREIHLQKERKQIEPCKRCIMS